MGVKFAEHIAHFRGLTFPAQNDVDIHVAERISALKQPTALSPPECSSERAQGLRIEESYAEALPSRRVQHGEPASRILYALAVYVSRLDGGGTVEWERTNAADMRHLHGLLLNCTRDVECEEWLGKVAEIVAKEV